MIKINKRLYTKAIIIQVRKMNDTNMNHFNLKHEDKLIEQRIKKELAFKSKILDEVIEKGKHQNKETLKQNLFSSCMRD